MTMTTVITTVTTLAKYDTHPGEASSKISGKL